MNAWCRRVVELRGFQFGVLTLIVLNAAALGLETVPSLYDPNRQLFRTAHWVIQAFFMAEMAIRFGASPSAPQFFRDGWNVFDTIVILAALVPAVGPTTTIARLTRVLRIARLVEVSDEMKLILGTIVHSMRSLTQLILLMLVLLYAYAIIGYHLFADEDPAGWGNIGIAMWNLFQTMTLEAWVDKQSKTFATSPHETWLFYSSFLIFTAYFILNLFVAVVVNNLQDLKAAQTRAADAANPQSELLAQIKAMKQQLDSFERQLREGKG